MVIWAGDLSPQNFGINTRSDHVLILFKNLSWEFTSIILVWGSTFLVQWLRWEGTKWVPRPLLVLGSVREQTGHTMEASQQVPFFHGFCFSLCLRVPTLVYLHDELTVTYLQDEINLFFSKLSLVSVFTTATVKQRRIFISIKYWEALHCFLCTKSLYISIFSHELSTDFSSWSLFVEGLWKP